MPELLIVGGLTIDRFADGTSAPGGSVLHAGLAAAAEGVRPRLLTVAGDESEARDGLARLARLGGVVRQATPSTIRYRHEERDGRRVLVYEAAAAALDPSAQVPAGRRPTVALMAPVADELPPAAVRALTDRLQPASTVLLIQGWLRRLEVGQPVLPLPLDAVASGLWELCAMADAVVVSTEDLAEAPQDPFAQAAALRASTGPSPVIVVTLGPEGYLLDDPAQDRVLASVPRRVVRGVPTVGAGDTFGAALALHLSRGIGATRAAAAATDRVIHTLESRATPQ